MMRFQYFAKDNEIDNKFSAFQDRQRVIVTPLQKKAKAQKLTRV